MSTKSKLKKKENQKEIKRKTDKKSLKNIYHQKIKAPITRFIRFKDDRREDTILIPNQDQLTKCGACNNKSGEHRKSCKFRKEEEIVPRFVRFTDDRQEDTMPIPDPIPIPSQQTKCGGYNIKAREHCKRCKFRKDNNDQKPKKMCCQGIKNEHASSCKFRKKCGSCKETKQPNQHRKGCIYRKQMTTPTCDSNKNNKINSGAKIQPVVHAILKNLQNQKKYSSKNDPKFKQQIENSNQIPGISSDSFFENVSDAKIKPVLHEDFENLKVEVDYSSKNDSKAVKTQQTENPNQMSEISSDSSFKNVSNKNISNAKIIPVPHADFENLKIPINDSSKHDPKPKQQFENSNRMSEIRLDSNFENISNNNNQDKNQIKSKSEIKMKNSSEEDLVYLGKVEKFVINENDKHEKCLITEKKIPKLFCVICDKEGHTSFECQMICKNCSEPYHNLNTCTKPINISIMFQKFMEFCMKQCCEYNPKEKFLPICPIEIKKPKHNKKRHHAVNNKNENYSMELKKKKRKKDKIKESITQFPNIVPFPQTLPFAAFSGHTASAAYNPILGFTPIPGTFNPNVLSLPH